METNKDIQALTDEQIQFHATTWYNDPNRDVYMDRQEAFVKGMQTACAILATRQPAPVASAPAVGQQDGEVDKDELQLMRGHASVIVTNICQHARNKHTMTGWLHDACTSAEILQQWIEKQAAHPPADAAPGDAKRHGDVVDFLIDCVARSPDPDAMVTECLKFFAAEPAPAPADAVPAQTGMQGEDIGCLREQAKAWHAVHAALTEVCPGWHASEVTTTGIERAVTAIKGLAQRAASQNTAQGEALSQEAGSYPSECSEMLELISTYASAVGTHSAVETLRMATTRKDRGEFESEAAKRIEACALREQVRYVIKALYAALAQRAASKDSERDAEIAQLRSELALAESSIASMADSMDSMAHQLNLNAKD